MKRFLMLVAVAAVAGAMYVAAAPGSQRAAGPTAIQFAALKKQVAGLSKKLTALKADETKVKKMALAEANLLAACDTASVPINDFGDFQNGTYGYHYVQPDGVTEIKTSALDISSSTDTGAGWFAFGGATCQGTVLSQAVRHAAARVGVRLPEASSHLPMLAAHRLSGR
jgi:hypothetical protein